MRIVCDRQKNDGVARADWLQARVGRITASSVAKAMAFCKQTKADAENNILRPKQERQDYLFELLAERCTLVPAEHFNTKAMQFGSDYEDDARRAYEVHAEVMVEQTGFVLHPAMDYFGASPDGLIADDGGIEIKVPTTETHISYLFGGVVPEEYRLQMYSNMLCCERIWWDFVSFDPRMPKEARLFIRRLYRDPEEIKRIESHVAQFNDELNAVIDRLREVVGNFALPVASVAQQPPPQDPGEFGIEDSDTAHWFEEQP